mgnify:CR=1 FL=1
MNQSIFYLLAALTVIFATMTVFAKNPIHSALYMVMTFFSITCHYVLLNAQFLAVVNFIVYMGAIMVLIIFAIMFLNLGKDLEPQKSTLVKFAGVIAAGLLLVTLVGAGRQAYRPKALYWQSPRPAWCRTWAGYYSKSFYCRLSWRPSCCFLLWSALYYWLRKINYTNGKYYTTNPGGSFRSLPGAELAAFCDRCDGRTGTQERDRDLHVGRADAERGEPAAGGFLGIPGRSGRADLRFLYYGRSCCGSSRGPGDHRDDLPEYPFDRC